MDLSHGTVVDEMMSDASARIDAEPAIHPSPVEFELVTSRPGFDALEQDWNALFDRGGDGTQVFQTFNWCWHWCNAFLDEAEGGTELSIVTGRRNGRLVLVLPLAIERAAGMRRLVWLGEPVSQYGDVVVDRLTDRDQVIEGAWTFLLAHAQADLVHLRKVRADSLVAPLLRRIEAVTTGGCAAPYLDLASAPDFAGYEQRYTGKARKNRRRLMRRLEEQGPVEIATLAEGPEASELAVQAIALKRAWLDARGILSPALADPRTREFFAAVARDGSRSTGCRVSVLRASGQAVGVQVGFLCKGRLNLHVIVYDLAYEKSGIGVLHLERCIAEAYAQGCHALDLLAPNDGYKMEWADAAVDVCDYAAPLSFAGRVYSKVYLGHVRGRLKQLASHVPGLARTAMALTAML